MLERGAQWPQWDFVKATKKEGGRVYIEPTHTGEVRFHEGYVTARELRAAEKQESRAKAKAKAEKEGKPARPAITQAMQILSRPPPPCRCPAGRDCPARPMRCA